MKPQSIRALMWFSIILLILGWFVMSPVASLLLAIIVILCALPVIFFGKLVACLISAAVLAGAIGLAATHYNEAKQQFKAFRNHAKKPNTPTPSAPIRVK